MFDALRRWARSLKRDVLALWLAARDPRVPWYAKLAAGAVAAYALSPIDLIPDFVPVLGYLDDLIIVPLGIILAIKLVPEPLMREFREEAARRAGRPRSWAGLAFIAVIWMSAAAATAWLVWPGQGRLN
ncbi:MAG TPA: YkvA family protein [Vineibacter sp.]|nr:YkvA family protein [Vineibacter sp.]